MSLKKIYYEKGNIPILDGLRGSAAILVLISHIFINQFKCFPLIDAFVIFSGHSGVELFFVLSGFLISYPFWRDYYFDKITFSYRNFYIRRALRVLPLFYISSILFILLSLFLNKDINAHLKIIPFYIFQIHNFFSKINFINPPTWTVAVELHFYILIYFFFMWKGTTNLKNTIITLFSILFILFIYKACAYTHVNNAENYRNLIYANTFARLDQFIVGIFLALLYNLMTQFDYFYKNIVSYRLIYFILGILLLFILSYSEYSLIKSENIYNNINYIIINPTITAIAWGLILLSGLSNLNFISHFFSSNILSMLGKLSFSIYLLHMPVYSWIFKPLYMKHISSNELSCSILFIPLIIVISFFSFTLIEKPFLKIKSKYLSVV